MDRQIEAVTGLDPELRDYIHQFEAIARDSRLLLAGLDNRQLMWREADGRWSIADCFDHLVVTGDQSLSRIHQAMIDARARGLIARGPFRYRWIDRWLVWTLDAPPGMKFKAPRAYRPAMNAPAAEVVAKFFLLQTALMTACEEASGIDLAAVKVTNPMTTWWSLSLGQELAFTAAHERRHVWQATRVRERLEISRTPLF